MNVKRLLTDVLLVGCGFAAGISYFDNMLVKKFERRVEDETKQLMDDIRDEVRRHDMDRIEEKLLQYHGVGPVPKDVRDRILEETADEAWTGVGSGATEEMEQDDTVQIAKEAEQAQAVYSLPVINDRQNKGIPVIPSIDRKPPLNVLYSSMFAGGASEDEGVFEESEEGGEDREEPFRTSHGRNNERRFASHVSEAARVALERSKLESVIKDPNSVIHEGEDGSIIVIERDEGIDPEFVGQLPFIITAEELENPKFGDYPIKNLTYYRFDDVLSNEVDVAIDDGDWEEYIPMAAIEAVSEVDMEVYVRNPVGQEHYIVTGVDGAYSQVVLGIDDYRPVAPAFNKRPVVESPRKKNPSHKGFRVVGEDD